MDVADNVARQRALYGASLGECLQRITAGLGLSQAAVARATGISAPMLSQLSSGHRIKIGNPQAAARFSALLGLVDEVERGLSPADVAGEVERIARSGLAPLTATQTSSGAEAAAGVVAGVLRAVASGRQLEAAAEMLQAQHPAIAEVLRVYGTGSAQDARRHYAGIAHLLG